MKFNDQLARSEYDREQDAITIDRLKNLLTVKATSEVESLIVKIYFVYKITHAIQRQQPSDLEYLRQGFTNDQLELTRLNYCLSETHGAIAYFKDHGVSRCFDTITLEEFFILHHEFRYIEDQYNRCFSDKLRDILQNAMNAFKCTQQLVVARLARLDGNFNLLPEICCDFYRLHHHVPIIREQIQQPETRDHSHNDEFLAEARRKISDALFALRQLLRNNRGKLEKLYVIERGLKRLEHDFSLLVGEVIKLQDDLKRTRLP